MQFFLTICTIHLVSFRICSFVLYKHMVSFKVCLFVLCKHLGSVVQNTGYSYPLGKVVHWTTPYPVGSQPLDKIGCSKTKTRVGQLSNGYNFVQWSTPMILCTICIKAIQTKNKRKGLLNSATFQVIFHAIQFICCDLQMIYDPSFCYLCVRAGNLCLHSHVITFLVKQIVNNRKFVFYLVLLTQCIRSFF